MMCRMEELNLLLQGYSFVHTWLLVSLKDRPLYSPEDAFAVDREINDQTFTIDHFYQKLLKLAASMNTEVGKEIALQRTRFMESYLQQLALEI